MGNLKNKKREWKYGAGAGLLKRGVGGGLALFLFLHLEITLPVAKLSYAFEKNYFFLPP